MALSMYPFPVLCYCLTDGHSKYTIWIKGTVFFANYPSNNRAIQSISSVSRVFRQLCLLMLFEEVAITSRHTSIISANILSCNNGIIAAIKRLHVKYLSLHCLKVHGNVFQIISGDNVTLVLHNMDLSLLDPSSAQICFGAFRSIVLQETGYTETILAGIVCVLDPIS